ncbi:ferredoxin [Streptomyces ziwulingensis]
MRIIADTGRCVGAGMCALTAGAVFDQHADDGTVVVLRPEPPAGTWAAVREAVAVCPAAALALSPAGGRDH